MASLSQGSREGVVDRIRIEQIQWHLMKPRYSWQPLRLARCAPDFMTSRKSGLRDCLANSQACAGEKDLFHDLEKHYALPGVFRVALGLIPILTVAPMQESPLRTMSILHRCFA
jgi:hypothetical protein